MISAELMMAVAALFFLVGGGMTVFRNQLTKFSLVFGTIAGVLFGWIIMAISVPRPVVDVVYYPIVQQRLEDGSVVDAINVPDEHGGSHYVNINKALAAKVPEDGNVYQVAQLRYSGLSLGLLFKERSAYKIIPAKK